ncbi:hypothetical protein QYE76_029201 [Lolium multiflorum]|uniref:Reverse transcriptase domain-containing protein n=1 Tax=Lolium multiflorum TaxID=4521 RepID=A0AAD8QMD8_LOLMU|nr:hypothetical protein QYE76_029201 [Lolium multiflorum]
MGAWRSREHDAGIALPGRRRRARARLPLTSMGRRWTSTSARPLQRTHQARMLRDAEHAAAQSTSPSPGTEPLGAVRREPAALEPEGLRNGFKAWRLKTTCGCRPEVTVTDTRGGSGRPSAMKNTSEFAGVRKLPRISSNLWPEETIQAPTAAVTRDPPFLASKTSKERRSCTRAVDPESTKDLNFGLIDGGAVHFVHHRIWLPPWKHHEQRKKKQPTPDLAGEIWYYPPGMTPNYGIEPTPSTTATPSMYIYSGASPPPSPAGNAAGEGSGLARPAEADSQSAYIEKVPFPAKMKEYSVISGVVNKSEKKPIEPEEQIKVEPAVAIVKDLVTENVEDGHIIFCEDASNIVSHPNKPKQVSVPMLSVRIGDHCYYGLCDIGASVSAIPYELYTEIVHEIGSCELEDIDVVIQLANRETISPIGIVRDVEVLCDCKKEKILTKFAGESYEFNFSKFTKTPYKADLPSDDFKMEQCASIVLVPNNPLQQHLENSESEVFRKERDELEEIFLRQPILKHDLPVEDLGTTPPPKEDPVFDLKPLPDNLKYAHIDDKKIYPVIISSKLSEIEEERLLEILKKHRGAIGYTLDDLKGISPSICQHAINMEDDAKPVVEHQRRLIPKMKEVVRNEVLKLLDAGIIYPIADSRWVSPVHCVPKKGGMTVVPNDNDELIPQRVVVGYRMCIDFRKFNKVTKKDHYPLPFIDQMLERLSKNTHFCFLDGYSGFSQIAVKAKDQEKTTFTCPYGTYAYRQVFMDDFSVYGNSFDNCLRNLDKVLQRCEETNLVLNWEKCHFMVNEGIVLGHKISERCIEVDRAKVEAIEKMPYPRDVKDRKGADNPVADNLSRLENIAYDPVPVNDSFPNEQLAVIKVNSRDSPCTMVSNNKDKGPLEEDIQDPELKEEVASEDEEEVEEVPRVHQRATIASIGVISNPSNTKRSARIATGGAVPRHYLAPRTSSPAITALSAT